jgi:hypothetical protein
MGQGGQVPYRGPYHWEPISNLTYGPMFLTRRCSGTSCDRVYWSKSVAWSFSDAQFLLEYAMNVAWRDLNTVQEAGDYPFRDGTITITFAEVAIWKKNPGAQFRLMRKYPIQNAFRYVLGRQIEENLAVAETELIYESSNGDSWCLTRDAATGARVVMHRPNPQSGGQLSYIETEKFLSEGANGPEHQALRRLMGTSVRMATILIACDIHPPKGGVYDDLIKAIQSLGAWWHHLETIWIVKCVHSPGEIRDRLQSCIGTDDQVLIIDISRATAGWVGINASGSSWLDDNI